MKKVLAIDVGGTKLIYAIINEKGEFLSEVKKTSTPKNIEELKNCILKYWNNPELAVQHGKNGYQKAITQYTEDSYYNKLIKIYEEVLNEKK